jgi:preprotein translocase subunit SecG
MLVFNIIIGIIFLVSILIVLVVLVQNPKGGGLSSAFGGNASNIMGVQKTGDLLEKLTWGLAISLMVLTLGSNFFLDKEAGLTDEIKSVNAERAAEVVTPSLPSSTTELPAETAPDAEPQAE